jgi:SAM-dependent methyltransferase
MNNSIKTGNINSNLRFAVTLVCPPNYIHSLALLEMAETINYALLNLGIDSILTHSLESPGRNQIILGAHLIDSIQNFCISENAIIYNFEQVTNDSSWLSTNYVKLLKSHKVWDYSENNIKILNQLGVNDVEYVPVGHTHQMNRIKKSNISDIDVLFYGSLNERRNNILDQLKNYGLNVVTVFGVYGAERDELISRSKIVLNIHYYESKIFEIVRISYLLSNGICVVSESGQDLSENNYKDCVKLCNYENIFQTCLNLLNNEKEREELSVKGRNYMKSFLQEDIINNLIKKSNPFNIMLKNKSTYITPNNFPSILNMGSGKDWKENSFNIDIQPEWNPDAIFDFNKKFPNDGIILETSRFGTIHLKENHFDLIYSMDVLEHLSNLTEAMSTCLRLLKVEGIMKINVPYDLSWGAWQDPTHVRAFNEKSWLYYTDWHWYLGWFDFRFDLLSLTYSLSSIGAEMQNQGIGLDIIARTPRAVDSMMVDLKKRPLTALEIQHCLQLRAN